MRPLRLQSSSFLSTRRGRQTSRSELNRNLSHTLISRSPTMPLTAVPHPPTSVGPPNASLETELLQTVHLSAAAATIAAALWLLHRLALSRRRPVAG